MNNGETLDNKDILFAKCNGVNGWLSLQNPYGFTFENKNWHRCQSIFLIEKNLNQGCH